MENKNTGKILRGIVVSTKMAKTVIVEIARSKTHPKYGKSFRINQKIKARNEIAGVEVGNTVIIRESKPIAKSVSFKVEKLEK